MQQPSSNPSGKVSPCCSCMFHIFNINIFKKSLKLMKVSYVRAKRDLDIQLYGLSKQRNYKTKKPRHFIIHLSVIMWVQTMQSVWVPDLNGITESACILNWMDSSDAAFIRERNVHERRKRRKGSQNMRLLKRGQCSDNSWMAPNVVDIVAGVKPDTKACSEPDPSNVLVRAVTFTIIKPGLQVRQTFSAPNADLHRES